MHPDGELVTAIRARLVAAADPSRAPQMRAYMKSAMPYLGVPVPAVRAIVRDEARDRLPQTTDGLIGTTLGLWRGAEYREERYAASALTGLPPLRRLQTIALVPTYYEMIVSGAWWDHVDEVSNRIGALLLSDPVQMRPIVRAWIADPNLWLRRVSIICQLRAKERTDLDLLTEAIERNAADSEFFIRKAIGWALRDYARTDPKWVQAFLEAHELSPLSRREAAKHLSA